MRGASGVDQQIKRAPEMSWRPRGVIFKPDTAIWWMAGGLGAFCALPRDDDTVRLFVTGRDSTVRSRIGAVVLQWRERPCVTAITSQPIFDLGEPGTFDMDGVSYPWVVKNGSELWMYYVGWNRLGGDIPFRNQLGLAVSTDGGQRFERVTRAPLLPLTDEEPIGSGSVWVGRTAGGWHMFYTNFLRWERRADGPRHYYHIREAYSADGITWERPGKIVVDLIAPDEYALAAPDMAVSNGRRTLYFTARGQHYRLFAAIGNQDNTWRRLPDPLNIPRSDFDRNMQCYPRNLVFGGEEYLLYSGDGYGRAGIGYAQLAEHE